ncbi:hypothetical protein [Streptomyces cellulosae]|uniref:Lipoprotein n=1 Tax=Streptomyces cellulosae TaxID=1968 RepID=A0ABW7Y268_STRCE
MPAATRPRRRGRTALLITGAVVLGLVAGTCVGYLVQADREPTPLASLSQPMLRQEKGEGPEPLSAARDRRVKTDGDLRKLLLKKPKGAKDGAWPVGSDGWMGLAAAAGVYKRPDEVYGMLVDDEFRRAAATGWKADDGYDVEVQLLQFRQEEVRGAAQWAGSNATVQNTPDSADTYAIPGTAEAMAYVDHKPVTKAGYQPLYIAEAHAWRGDIAMDITVSGSKPIARKTILDLATRQMERL